MIRGVFASHNGIVGDRVGDLASRVLTTMPGGTAPLLALSSGMESAPVNDTAFSWIEDQWLNGNTTAAETVNSAAVDFDVADPNIWIPGTIIMNETSGEYMLITAITGVNVTVIRGFGGTPAATVTSGHRLQSVGTTHAEGSGRPDPVAQRGDPRTNYTQIFKNAWAITGTAKAVSFHTGSQMALNRSQCFAYHAEDIERAFLWGRKDLRVLGSKQLRTSNGVLAQITDFGGLVEAANYGGNAGTMSVFGLQNFLRRVTDTRAKGFPNERIAFSSSLFLELLNQMATRDSAYQVHVSENEYGMEIVKLNFVNGNIKFLTHPMMVDNAKWDNELYVLHPGLIRKRVLRKTWSEEFSPEKQNNNGMDATEGYIADELGFEIKGAKTMGIMTAINTSAASY